MVGSIYDRWPLTKEERAYQDRCDKRREDAKQGTGEKKEVLKMYIYRTLTSYGI